MSWFTQSKFTFLLFSYLTCILVCLFIFALLFTDLTAPITVDRSLLPETLIFMTHFWLLVSLIHSAFLHLTLNGGVLFGFSQSTHSPTVILSMPMASPSAYRQTTPTLVFSSLDLQAQIASSPLPFWITQMAHPQHIPNRTHHVFNICFLKSLFGETVSLSSSCYASQF